MTDPLADALPQLAPSSIRHRVLAALRRDRRRAAQTRTAPDREQICSQMAVSRGPVREAMRALELEGLIISTPYKGAEVLEISDREVLELLMPIRMALEEFGFRCALENATTRNVNLLEAIIERMARAVK